MNYDLYPPCQCWVCVSLREGNPPETFTQVRWFSPEGEAYARERGAYDPYPPWPEYKAKLRQLWRDREDAYDDDW
jgi:hypothetical protein